MASWNGFKHHEAAALNLIIFSEINQRFFSRARNIIIGASVNHRQMLVPSYRQSEFSSIVDRVFIGGDRVIYHGMRNFGLGSAKWSLIARDFTERRSV